MSTKHESKELALAMCWYDESQWNILKELDPDTLDDSYDTWRANATRAMHELTQAGHNIKKVAIKIDAFLQWCDERGMDPNADSRTAYAIWKLKHRRS
jgi:hypothetical protein